MNLAWLFVGTLFVFFLCSCVSIRHSGSHDVKYCFGAPQIKNTGKENIRFIDITHYGFGVTNKTVVLGYLRRSDVYLKEMDKCSAIIYVSDYQQLLKIKEHISAAGKDINNLCFINGD